MEVTLPPPAVPHRHRAKATNAQPWPWWSLRIVGAPSPQSGRRLPNPPAPSLRHLPQQVQDLLLDLRQLGVDLVQRARWLVLEEHAVEVDLVADLADAAVLLVQRLAVDPGVGHVRAHLAQHVADDVLLQRDVLGVLQRRVRFVLDVLALAIGVQTQKRVKLGLRDVSG